MELNELKVLLDLKTSQFTKLEKQGKSREELAPLYKELKDLQYQLLQLELKTIEEQEGQNLTR